MIQKLYLALQKLETLGGPPWDLALLADLKEQFAELADSSEFEICKISELQKHLHEKMTAQTLQNILVPIERFLQKNIIETDFMVTNRDRPQLERKTFPVVLVLDNLRSSFNVGSFLRTAEALGLAKVVMAGYTATPENIAVQKTSLGSHESVAWEKSESCVQAIAKLKNENYRIIGVETSQKSVSLAEAFNRIPTAFIFGNERFGLGAEVLALCDEIRQIPLVGVKNSLNVGICAGIISYEWIRQWQQK